MKHECKMKRIIMFFIIAIIMSIFNTCFASSGEIDTSGVTIGQSYTTEFKSIGENILGFVQVIGSAASVITIAVIGIKYMLGSVEEKAEKKQALKYYLIGAVLVFATVNIVSILYNAIV
ncbi:MAG TPA: hypothetical protein DCE23_02475 [Firmicutes bacterium]|nr:hypothetical protein [Bacillota bacterium]